MIDCSDKVIIKSMDLNYFRKYLTNGFNKGILDEIRFFTSNDLSYMSDKLNSHFILLENDGKIIGLCKLANYPFDGLDVYSISFLTIVKEFRNKGYSRMMVDELFKLAKQNKWKIKTSSYTYVGFIKLRNIFNEYSEKHLVEFIDKKDDDSLIDTESMYDDKLIHRDEY